MTNPNPTRFWVCSKYSSSDRRDESRLHRVQPCVSSIDAAQPLATTGAKSLKALWTSCFLFEKHQSNHGRTSRAITQQSTRWLIAARLDKDVQDRRLCEICCWDHCNPSKKSSNWVLPADLRAALFYLQARISKVLQDLRHLQLGRRNFGTSLMPGDLCWKAISVFGDVLKWNHFWHICSTLPKITGVKVPAKT